MPTLKKKILFNSYMTEICFPYRILAPIIFLNCIKTINNFNFCCCSFISRFHPMLLPLFKWLDHIQNNFLVKVNVSMTSLKLSAVKCLPKMEVEQEKENKVATWQRHHRNSITKTHKSPPTKIVSNQWRMHIHIETFSKHPNTHPPCTKNRIKPNRFYY